VVNEHDTINQAHDRLIETLGQVPTFELHEHHWTGRDAGQPADPRYDLSVRVEAEGGGTWLIHCGIKRQAHPKQVREAIAYLKHRTQQRDRQWQSYHVLVAPYLSVESARICQQEEVGYLDLSGNCHIAFGQTYIHVEGKPNRFKETRPLRSLFSPKTSRLLRVLLQGPLVAHKVVDLAEAADVSTGLVSKLRSRLLSREWAEQTTSGLRITKPDAILDAWAKTGGWDSRTTIADYSLLVTDPHEIASRIHDHLGGSRHAFTQWFAAYLRHPHTPPPIVSLYVSGFPDGAGLKSELGARRVESGGRLRLIVPNDEGVFLCGQEVRGLPIVSDVQIYLDVLQAGLRGEEAARELREWDDFSGGWR